MQNNFVISNTLERERLSTKMANQEKTTASLAQPVQETESSVDMEKTPRRDQQLDRSNKEVIGANSDTENLPTLRISNNIINKIVLVPLISNPKNYSRFLKIYITLVVAQVAAIDTFFVSIFYRKSLTQPKSHHSHH